MDDEAGEASELCNWTARMVTWLGNNWRCILRDVVDLPKLFPDWTITDEEVRRYSGEMILEVVIVIFGERPPLAVHEALLEEYPTLLGYAMAMTRVDKVVAQKTVDHDGYYYRMASWLGNNCHRVLRDVVDLPNLFPDWKITDEKVCGYSPGMILEVVIVIFGERPSLAVYKALLEEYPTLLGYAMWSRAHTEKTFERAAPPLVLPKPTTVHQGPAAHNGAPSDKDSKCGPHNRECLAQSCAEAMTAWIKVIDARLKKEPRDDCIPGWEHTFDEAELLAVHRWFCASQARVVSPDEVKYVIFDAEYEGCLDGVSGTLRLTWSCPNTNCGRCDYEIEFHFSEVGGKVSVEQGVSAS